MAIPWVSALQAVPWAEVIDKAPRIADGAMKLWNTVAQKKARASSTGDMGKAAVGTPESQAMAALLLRLEASEASVEVLQQQVMSSLEMTAGLAAQNVQLVKGMEEMSRLMTRIIVATGAVAVLAVAALGFSMFNLLASSA